MKFEDPVLATRTRMKIEMEIAHAKPIKIRGKLKIARAIEKPEGVRAVLERMILDM